MIRGEIRLSIWNCGCGVHAAGCAGCRDELCSCSLCLEIISGACAIALVAIAPEVTTTAETTEYLRWFTGKIGFSAAGLALITQIYRTRICGYRHRHAIYDRYASFQSLAQDSRCGRDHWQWTLGRARLIRLCQSGRAGASGG